MIVRRYTRGESGKNTSSSFHPHSLHSTGLCFIVLGLQIEHCMSACTVTASPSLVNTVGFAFVGVSERYLKNRLLEELIRS